MPGPVWTVYMVRCHDDSLYTGIAVDVARRFAEHQAQGARTARYLRGRGPLELVYTVEVPDRSDALKLEYRIKTTEQGGQAATAGRGDCMGSTRDRRR